MDRCFSEDMVRNVHKLGLAGSYEDSAGSNRSSLTDDNYKYSQSDSPFNDSWDLVYYLVQECIDAADYEFDAVKAALDRSDSARAACATASLRAATANAAPVASACDAFEGRLNCGSLSGAARQLESLSRQFGSLRDLIQQLEDVPCDQRAAAFDATRDHVLWELVGGLEPLSQIAAAARVGIDGGVRRGAQAREEALRMLHCRGGSFGGGGLGQSQEAGRSARYPRTSSGGLSQRNRAAASSGNALADLGAGGSPKVALSGGASQHPLSRRRHNSVGSLS